MWQVILMIGMPGSGKTYWAKKHCAANPDKRYNILSTGTLFDRMKVCTLTAADTLYRRLETF